MRLMPYLFLPTVALIAQAPAGADLAQRFNAELPAVTQMLKELKAPEALNRVQGIIPAERPAFNGAGPKEIGQSLDNMAGLISLYRLSANVTSENGLWEKAVEIQERRLRDAKATLSDLEKAQGPIAAQWKQVAQDATDYTTKNTARQQELTAALKAVQDEVAAVNANQKKLDPKSKEMAELQARVAKFPQEQAELDQINAALPVHKQNLANAPKVAKMLADNRKEVETMIKTAEEALDKARKAVADQKDEITRFNTEQVMKKVKIAGNRNWVDAVLRSTENITKLGGPQQQAAFLSRLLFLDPSNPGAQKALDNLKAGKEPFPKEAKPAKKSASKKK
ncbi:MAG: hypothetical protein ACOYNX_00205 [Geothrix sp.]